MAFDHTIGANHGGISPIGALPRSVAKHRNRSSRSSVISGGEETARKRANAKSRKVVSGHVFAAQWFGHAVNGRPPHAKSHGRRLERRYLFKFGCRCLQSLVQRKRNHAPLVLRAAFDAALISISNSIKTGGISYRQGAKHNSMNQRENSRCAANAESQRQNSRQSKNRRKA